MNSKFETNFPLQHQQKDLRLAIDMADYVDQPMYVVSAANEVFSPSPFWDFFFSPFAMPVAGLPVAYVLRAFK